MDLVRRQHVIRNQLKLLLRTIDTLREVVPILKGDGSIKDDLRYFYNRLLFVLFLADGKFRRLLESPQFSIAEEGVVADMIRRLEASIRLQDQSSDSESVATEASSASSSLRQMVSTWDAYGSDLPEPEEINAWLDISALQASDSLKVLGELGDALTEPDHDVGPFYHARGWQEPRYEVGRRAQSLYDAFAVGLNCCPHEHDAAARMALATHRTSPSKTDHVTFGLSLCLECSDDLWKEMVVCVKERPEKKATAVRFQDDQSSQTARRDISSSTKNRPPVSKVAIKQLCATVIKVLRELPPSDVMNLELEGTSLYKLKSFSGPSHATQRCPTTVTLAQLLSDRCDLEEKPKRVLALILANTFLHLYGGPWLRGSTWTSDQVVFVERKSKLYIQPYLHALLGTNQSQTRTSLRQQHSHTPLESVEDPDFVIHPFPALVMLGTLLLEVWCGRHIHDLAQEHNMVFEDYSSRSYITLARVFEREKQYMSNNARSAINACLDPNLAVDLDGTTDDEEYDRKFRLLIYDKVVAPLEDEFVSGWNKVELDQLDSHAGELEIRNYVGSRDSDDEDKPNSVTTHIIARKKETLPNIGKITSQRPCSIPQFFDDILSHKGSNAASAESADEWIKDYKTVYQQVLESLHLRPPSRKIRIAILDTGVDMGHRMIFSLRPRIKDGESWVEGTWKIDADGHGTHTTSIIGELAPSADIYMGKIAVAKPGMPDEIAQAVRHAVQEWQVDILVMSFGFRRETGRVEDYIQLESAIQEAANAGVLMFAAASNGGGNTGRAYPASDPHVICVHSCDGLGNPLDHCPTRLPDRSNFSTLGQDVEGAFPLALCSAPQLRDLERKSGTSVATPIATAIAAFVLEFADRILGPELTARLSRRSTMEAVLKLISSERKGYSYLNLNYFRDNAPEFTIAGLRKAIGEP